MESSAEQTQYLLDFFKVLADEKRLQIVGLLARQDYSVEELAAILELSPATVSHHLARLVKVNLVEARADQHYHIYSLQIHALRDKAQQLLARDTWKETAKELDLDAYDRKILHDYMTADGRLKSIPLQRKKREVILRYLLDLFEPNRRYLERQVNEIIGEVHEDYATFRRELVDGKLMTRDRETYWRIS